MLIDFDWFFMGGYSLQQSAAPIWEPEIHSPVRILQRMYCLGIYCRTPATPTLSKLNGEMKKLVVFHTSCFNSVFIDKSNLSKCVRFLHSHLRINQVFYRIQIGDPKLTIRLLLISKNKFDMITPEARELMSWLIINWKLVKSHMSPAWSFRAH